MVIENTQASASRALLGLRPPAELADRSSSGHRTAAGLTNQDVPNRPDYQVVSSGRDSEDDESRGKTSDIVTALGAGAVLVLFLAAIGLLLN